jgi:hypothetical protein
MSDKNGKMTKNENVKKAQGWLRKLLQMKLKLKNFD